MLELLVILALLIGVPALAVVVIAGSAAYVQAGAERELEAMVADQAEVDSEEDDTGAPGDRRAAETDENA